MSNATRVWVTDNALNERVPTFHTWVTRMLGDGTYRTHCGLVTFQPDIDSRRLGLYLRSDHARKIGKPCRTCDKRHGFARWGLR